MKHSVGPPFWDHDNRCDWPSLVKNDPKSSNFGHIYPQSCMNKDWVLSPFARLIWCRSAGLRRLCVGPRGIVGVQISNTRDTVRIEQLTENTQEKSNYVCVSHSTLLFQRGTPTCSLRIRARGRRYEGGEMFFNVSIIRATFSFLDLNSIWSPAVWRLPALQ